MTKRTKSTSKRRKPKKSNRGPSGKAAQRQTVPLRQARHRKEPRASDKISPSSTADRVLAAVKRIPRGKVSTYGDIAEVAGMPRRARLVGTVLRQSPGSRDLPWFRVINAGGRISFPAGTPPYERQRSKLEAEGIVFVGDRVNLKRYGWPSRDEQLDEYLWKPR
jgi:methylated-DNA-protein-cysteine methyltransferase related protein